jgi:hypothetical protein
VPEAAFDAASLPNLRKKFVEFMGQGVEFQFNPVEEIKREASGKTRLCISRVAKMGHANMNAGVGREV